jgi:hypothetical protein
VGPLRIRWSIRGLDALEEQHLLANVEYSMLDMMLEARRTIKRLEDSRFLNMKILPTSIKSWVEMAKAQGDVMLDDIGKMYKLEIVKTSGGVALELFISTDYFTMGEVIKQQFGRAGARLIKVVDQQTIIDRVEEDLRKVYMKPFSGEVLQDDGKRLVVSR